MGRELRRREEKKSGKRKRAKKEKITKSINPYNDIYKMLKTFGLILVIVLVIYFLVAILITKELDWFKKDNVNDDTNNFVNSDVILARNTFMQTDSEYYVYYYDFDDDDTSISTLISSNLSNSKVYKVDISDAFNSNYISDDVNITNDIEEFKISTTTLIKIVDSDIVESYTSKDDIKEYLEGKN